MNPTSAIQARHPRSATGLAEAVQVCTVLGVRSGRHAEWLAECLGLEWREQIRKTDPSSAAEAAVSPTSADPAPPSAEPSPEKEQSKKRKLLQPVAHEPMKFDKALGPETAKVRKAQELMPAAFMAGQERPPFQPLLLERWFQGIFTAILSTEEPSRDIDFRQLERSAAEGGVLNHLPLKTRSSLTRGVHVLLDRSESMQLFRRDQTELLARLRRLLGDALVQHTWFKYDALRPAASRIGWLSRLPGQFQEGAPVLLVTDFGSGWDGSAARLMDWEPWAPVLQQAGCNRCPVFALIPSSPEDWPASINQYTQGALLWDRETSPHKAIRECRK